MHKLASLPRCGGDGAYVSVSFDRETRNGFDGFRYPFHDLIKAQLQDYGIRPQTPAYADITLAIQNALSPTSSIAPNTIVSTLRSEIKQSLGSGALL